MNSVDETRLRQLAEGRSAFYKAAWQDAEDRYNEILLIVNQMREAREQAERERDEAKFSPLGDNHHNAAACPHCGDLLGKAVDRAVTAEACETQLRQAIAEAAITLRDALARPEDAK